MTIFHRASETRLLPEGDYRAVVETVVNAESINGNPKLEVGYVIKHEGTEHRLKDHVPLHIAWRVDQLCDAFGQATCGDGNSFDDEKMVGLSCQVSVKHETWDGKVRARIGRLQQAGQGVTDDCPF